MYCLLVCVCCVCDPNDRFGVFPYILFVCMSEVISAFSAVCEGSQLFASPMLFLCCILVVICSGRCLHVVCIFCVECYVI